MSLEEIRRLPTINSGIWCDRHSLRFERLYGTDLHQRGQTLPDLGLRPFTDEELAVLKRSEVGNTPFTIDGWLDVVERASSAARDSTRQNEQTAGAKHE